MPSDGSGEKMTEGKDEKRKRRTEEPENKSAYKSVSEDRCCLG